LHIFFVDDLDTVVAEIAGRGLEPTKREIDPNGERRAIHHDPDGRRI
jgi:hypothetical protein